MDFISDSDDFISPADQSVRISHRTKIVKMVKSHHSRYKYIEPEIHARRKSQATKNSKVIPEKMSHFNLVLVLHLRASPPIILTSLLQLPLKMKDFSNFLQKTEYLWNQRNRRATTGLTYVL